jgi:drug/metabolite transporter (DMT)-like permease
MTLPQPLFATPSQRLIAVSAVIAGTFLFACKGIVIKLAYAEGLTTAPLLLLRMTIALPCYALVALWLCWKHPVKLGVRQLLQLTGLGLLGYYLSSYLDFWGLEWISAGLERAILYLYPTFVLLMLAGWKKQPLAPAVILGLVVSYLGALLVLGGDIATQDQHALILGSALVLAGTLCFALFVVLAGEMMKRLSSVRFTAWAMLAASGGAITHGLVTSGLEAFAQTPRIYTLASVLAVFCTVLPSFCVNFGISRLGSGQAALLGGLGPIFTLCMGAWWLSEPLTPLKLLGSLLVIAGVSFSCSPNHSKAAHLQAGSSR